MYCNSQRVDMHEAYIFGEFLVEAVFQTWSTMIPKP
ncbi:unnamed protein product [Larinioides sclopetarius]|uniref:Uncharacterized protein n=1 Tax=Larinioides sclopetarius TaxID=280406 RepID=A0AAV1ZTH9_9ARAC